MAVVLMRVVVGVLLVLGLITTAFASSAQQTDRVRRLGLLHVGLDHVPPSLVGLREGLKALGYEDGKNVRLDWRNLADEAAARETARQFASERVDVIVAFESQSVRAAKAATTEVPIVFLHVTDPVAEGFVKSLSHPGGNLTGFAEFFSELMPKRLELLKDMIPQLRRLLVLVGPEDPEAPMMRAEVRKAAATLGITLLERDVRTAADVERVFGSLKREEVDGVVLATSNLYTNFPSLIVRLTSEKRLPVVFHRKEWVEQGSLMSYGVNFRVLGEEAARYVDKILRGARPDDLPVERPTKLELVVNLKTARALGLTVPQSLLLRADQTIE